MLPPRRPDLGGGAAVRPVLSPRHAQAQRHQSQQQEGQRSGGPGPSGRQPAQGQQQAQQQQALPGQRAEVIDLLDSDSDFDLAPGRRTAAGKRPRTG